MSEGKKPANTRLKFLLLLLLAVFLCGVIAALMTPNMNGSHTSPSNYCINNLRQIDAAANQFALEHHLTNGEAINYPTDLMPYIKLNSKGQIPGCPQGGIYSIKKVGDTPTCSLGTTVTPAHVLQ